MAREFAVTTPSASVSLAPDGRGEVVFSVTNVTGVPMRARASFLLGPGLKPKWVSLRGERAREMPAGSTEVFTVELRVPPAPPPGSHSFRLVVADVALPDERYTEGPAISVRVVPTAPLARPFPWWVLVLGTLVVLGGALAAFFLLRDGEAPPPVQECPPGQTQCEGRCVSLLTDLRHCGACGTACEARFECREGQCVRTGCPEGQALCEGACVDTRTDTRNCGRCGTTCPSHLTCRDGRCLCPAEGQSNCGGRCADLRADEQNCGLCNKRCASGQTCQDRVCRCPSGQSLCDGRCVDTRVDEQHCGRCGSRCASGSDCRGGRCVPRPGCPIAGQVLCPCTGTCLSPALCQKRCGQDVQPF